MPDTIYQALDIIPASTLRRTNIVDLLTHYGCNDLTPSIDDPACSRYPIASNSLGDAFSGQLANGTRVVIKTIREFYDFNQSARVYHKQAARDIYKWSECKHPNVAALSGFAVFRDNLATVSLHEENGNLFNYLSQHPNADRCSLSSSICAGLAYLHENNIVHGNLKGANILIAQDGRPTIIDFGNASLMDVTRQLAQTHTRAGYSARWAAPEILGEKTSYTTVSDVYSLGMTILEAFTSQVPFPHIGDALILAHVLVLKNTPTRPEKIIPTKSLGGDKLWDILTQCWSYEPENRPGIAAVWDTMKEITPDQLVETVSEEEARTGEWSGERNLGLIVVSSEED